MSPGPAKQFDRTLALERAMECFWEHGYEGTSLTALLQHMEIGRQSLYDTFGDKRSLFLEALRAYADAQIGPMVALLEAPGSAADNLRTLFAAWVELSGSDEHKGCFTANTCADLGTHDEEVEAILTATFSRFEKTLVKTLERARDEGSLRVDVNLRELSQSFVAVGQGLAVLSRSERGVRYAKATTKTLEVLLLGS